MNTLTHTVTSLYYLAQGFRLQAEAVAAENQRLEEELAALRVRLAEVEATRPAAMAPGSAWLRRIESAIAVHLSDENFGVEALADAVGISRSQLHRRLKGEAGTTPVELIRHRRLEASTRLLAAGEATVEEVAAAVGFNSASYFARCFRRTYRMPPSAYGRR